MPDWAWRATDFLAATGGSAGATVLVALAFWCSGSRLGLRLGWAVALSLGLNTLLKWSFAAARPYYVTELVSPRRLTQGFGMPSGHAQVTATAWGGLGFWLRRPAVLVAATCMVLLTGLSRVLDGVHSAGQVSLGWAVGLAVVLSLARAEPVLERLARRVGPRFWLLAGFGASSLLGVVGWLLLMFGPASRPPPDLWQVGFRSAAQTLGVEATLQPALFATVLRSSGSLLGVAVVARFYAGKAEYRPASWNERLVNFAVGFPCLAWIWWLRSPLVAAIGGAGEVLVAMALVFSLGVLTPVAARRIGRALESSGVEQ